MCRRQDRRGAAPGSGELSDARAWKHEGLKPRSARAPEAHRPGERITGYGQGLRGQRAGERGGGEVELLGVVEQQLGEWQPHRSVVLG